MAITGIPVVVRPSGGLPVTVSSSGRGILMSPASSGMPVTIVGQYGMAIVGLGGSDVPPNYAMLALPGSFVLTGEPMTPVASLTFPVGVGTFAFAWQNATLTPPATAYTGPGNVQASATAWYGLRAYSSATGVKACIDLVDQAGNQPVTINIKANGDIDVTAITNWVAAGSPAITTIKVFRIYDQVGTRHLKTAGASGTLAQMPTLVLSGFGSHPVIHFASPNDMNTQGIGGAALGLTNPCSAYAVAKATTANSTAMVIGAIGPLTGIFWQGANTFGMFAGGGVTSIPTAAADGTFWTVQAVFNGASSIGQVATTQTTALNPGSADLTGEPSISNSSFAAIMDWLEGGHWSGDKSATFNAVNSNAKAYWGY